MGRSRRRAGNKRKQLSGRPAAQAAPRTPPSATSLSKGKYHIDWTQMNFLQIIAFFFILPLFTISFVFSILNGFHLLRPEAAIFANSTVNFIFFVAAVLSAAAGIFSIKKINLFGGKNSKPKQAFYAFIAGFFVSLLLFVLAVPIFPSQAVVHPNPVLSPIPFPPYKGVLVLDGMPSKPAPKYFWEQRVDGQESCKFVGSAYHIVTTKQDSLELCEAFNTNFQNFALEADMSFAQPGTAIIFFRFVSQVSYQLVIQSIGDYAELSLDAISLSKNVPAIKVALIQPILIVNRDQGPAYFAPGYENHIGIEAINQSITIYINGKTAQNFHVTDDSSSQGAIALGAFTPSSQSETQTDVVFSKVRVWQL